MAQALRPAMRRVFAAALLGGAIGVTAPAAVAQEAIRLAGSTTLLPIITDAANAFRAKYGTWDKVEPSLPAAEIVIYTSGGGSSGGVRAAIDGTAQIGMVARDLRPQEIQRLGEHEAHLIAIDGIVIAARHDNPLFGATDTLTREQVARIFAGEVTRYRDFASGLPDREIVLLIRDASGGSTEIMQEEVMKQRAFAASALQMPSIGTQIRRLESNANAIAYTSAGAALRSETVKTFAIDGTTPTSETLAERRYPLHRPLLLVVRADQRTPQVRAFIDFLRSDEGQAIIARHDFVPVRGAGRS